jgi:hypothetical protein
LVFAILEVSFFIYNIIRWGFSPWQSLEGESVLIIGAGDPRHVVKTMAEYEGGKVGFGVFIFIDWNICDFRRKYSCWSRMFNFTADR